MFVLDIDYNDGVSRSEIVLVQRSSLLIGSGKNVHVLIEGSAICSYDVRIVKGLGRKFSCIPVQNKKNKSKVSFVEGIYESEAMLKFGHIRVRVVNIDNDFHSYIKATSEQVFNSNLELLRLATSSPTPEYPAVVVLGAKPLFYSFSPADEIVIGRAQTSNIILEASDISSNHLSVKYNNDAFEIKDLQSTNGTYVNDIELKYEAIIDKTEIIRLGSNTFLRFISNEHDLKNLFRESLIEISSEDVEFPQIIASSESVFPEVFSLKNKSKVIFGRDHDSDIWIGSSFISRSHLEIELKEEKVNFVNLGKNSVSINGEELKFSSSIELERSMISIDFGSGISFYLCFNKDEELEARNNFSKYLKNKNKWEMVTENSFSDGSGADYRETVFLDRESLTFDEKSESNKQIGSSKTIGKAHLKEVLDEGIFPGSRNKTNFSRNIIIVCIISIIFFIFVSFFWIFQAVF